MSYFGVPLSDIMTRSKAQNPIPIYCKCESCQKEFDVTRKKRSKFCSSICRKRFERLSKKKSNKHNHEPEN